MNRPTKPKNMIESTNEQNCKRKPDCGAAHGSRSWLPITIFLSALFGGVIAIGIYVAYWMPCPADWTGEWRQKWVGVQVQSFCLWSTAWALVVRATSKLCSRE